MGQESERGDVVCFMDFQRRIVGLGVFWGGCFQDATVTLLDAPIQALDLFHQAPELEAMMVGNLAGQGEDQQVGLGLEPTAGQVGQARRVLFPGDQ